MAFVDPRALMNRMLKDCRYPFAEQRNRQPSAELKRSKLFFVLTYS
jgi:hypothetical protein